MPIYSIRGQDGKTYSIEGPPNATEEQVWGAIQQELGTRQGGITGAFKKGAEQLWSSGRTAYESVTGNPNEAAQAGLARDEEIASKYKDEVGFDKVKEAFGSGVWPGLGELASQIPKGISQQLPNIGASIAGARIGSLAGPVGAVAGAFAPSFIQQLGGNVERQGQVQEDAGQATNIDVGSAAAAAVPQAALDVGGMYIAAGTKLAGKIFGPEVEKLIGKLSAEEVDKVAAQGFFKTLAKGVGKGALAEIPTEVTQQVIERAQAGLSLTDADALKEYGETAYQVGLLAPLGGLGSFADRSSARSELEARNKPADTEALKEEINKIKEDTPVKAVDDTAPSAAVDAALANPDAVLKKNADTPISPADELKFAATAKEQKDKVVPKAAAVKLTDEEAVAKLIDAKLPPTASPFTYLNIALKLGPARAAKIRDQLVEQGVLVKDEKGKPRFPQGAPNATIESETPTGTLDRADTGSLVVDPPPAAAANGATQVLNESGLADPNVPVEQLNAGEVGSATPVVVGEKRKRKGKAKVLTEAPTVAAQLEILGPETYTDAYDGSTPVSGKPRVAGADVSTVQPNARKVKSPIALNPNLSLEDNYYTKKGEPKLPADTSGKVRPKGSLFDTIDQVKKRAEHYLEFTTRKYGFASAKTETAGTLFDSLNNIKNYGSKEGREQLNNVRGTLAGLEKQVFPEVVEKKLPPSFYRKGEAPSIASALGETGMYGALRHIAATANMTPTDKLANHYSAMSDILSNLDYSGTKSYVEGTHPEKDAEFAKLKENGQVAEYRPAENAFYFTKDGLNRDAVVHEAFHAATLKRFDQFNKFKSLKAEAVRRATESRDISAPLMQGMTSENLRRTEARSSFKPNKTTYGVGDIREGKDKVVEEIVEGKKDKGKRVSKTYVIQEFSHLKQAEDAVEHLYKIHAVAKERLKDKTQFKHALSSVHEFISYAMTDTNFRNELAKHKSPNLAKYTKAVRSLWNQFTEALANLLGLVKPEDVHGNLLLEASEAINKILTTPTKLEGYKAMPSEGQTKGPKTHKVSEQYYNSPEQDIADDAKKLNEQQSVTHGVKAWSEWARTKKGYEEFVRMLGNSRRPLETLESAMRAASKLILDVASDVNDFATRLRLSQGLAEKYVVRNIAPHTDKINIAIAAYAKKNGITINDALSKLNRFFTAIHEPERRHVKFLLYVPLDTIEHEIGGVKVSPAALRDAIMVKVYTNKAISKEDMATLRNRLEYLAKNHADEKGASALEGQRSLDENHSMYNVISDRPREYWGQMRDLFEKDLKDNGDLIREIQAEMKNIDANGRELNRHANFWPQAVDNIVALYGYKHYVPFKGMPGTLVSKLDANLDNGEVRYSKELNEISQAFQGRYSDSENVIAQTMVDGNKAALRAGYMGVTLRIKNAIRQGYIPGEIMKDANVPFRKRYKEIDMSKLYAGRNDIIFHYEDDGSITPLRITDERLKEAVRRTYKQNTPLTDALNTVTSKIGQMHTRYNPAFHPYNFIRDMMTNAFVVGSDMDPATAGKFMANTASIVARGKLGVTMRVSYLYNNGKFNEIEALAKKDPYVKAALEYLNRGGRVAMLQGLTPEKQVEITKESGPNRTLSWKNFNSIVDIWSETFELSARTAAYMTIKDKMVRDNPNWTDKIAQEQAASYVKGLANFEQVGVWGKQAGALFMFFRPSMTGAIRALDAVTPGLPFGLYDADKDVASLPASIRAGAGEEAFRLDHAKKGKNARIMMMATIGAGAAIYMMAMAMAEPDENNGENRVAIDDMSQWQRNARIPLPDFAGGKTRVFNLPWGFGFGAFGAIGAQMMAAAFGKSGLGNATINSVQILLDSFLPMPVSKIDPSADLSVSPLQFTMDTITPSVVRPVLEYLMNMNGIGQGIYSTHTSKYGEAYVQSEAVPDVYERITSAISDATLGDVKISPNVLNFWMNNYLDGLGRIFIGGYGTTQWLGGQKDFDPKADPVIASSFIGKKSDYDTRQYAIVEAKVQRLRENLNMFKDHREQFDKYVNANPNAVEAVLLYNHVSGGQLKYMQELQSKITGRASGYENMTPKERTAALKEIRQVQNMIKRGFMMNMRAIDIEP